MNTYKFKITNLTCGACIKISTLSLKAIPGVSNIKILATGEAGIESDQAISWDRIHSALQSVGKNAIQM